MNGYINQEVANVIKLLADKCFEVEQDALYQPMRLDLPLRIKHDLESFMYQFRDVVRHLREKPGFLRVCFVGYDETKGDYVSMKEVDEQYRKVKEDGYSVWINMGQRHMPTVSCNMDGFVEALLGR